MSVSSIHRLRRFLDRVRYEWLERRPSYQSSMEAGLAAKASEDWMAACHHFSNAAYVRPRAAGVRLQLGHALKEVGRIEEAETSYRQAVRLEPYRVDAYLHLGHALSVQGRREEASAAYARAAASPGEPHVRGARAAQNLTPGTKILEGRKAMERAYQDLHILLAELQVVKADLNDAGTYPAEAWARLHADFPIRPPQEHIEGPLHIIIDARLATPSAVRASLEALDDLEHDAWNATLLADKDIREHPVASIAYRNPRVSLVDRVQPVSMATLLVGAGARLEPHALGWFELLARQANADVLYADHDHHAFSHDLREGRSRPVLLPAPGRQDILTSPETAACIWISPNSVDLALEALTTSAGATARRKLLWIAKERDVRLRHAPIVLSSVWTRTEASPRDPGFLDELLSSEQASLSPARILSIVPTRDQSGLLNACVTSLQERASNQSCHSVVVVDNRSDHSETLKLLGDWRKHDVAQVLTFDEPFNWSRANNLGATNRLEDIFLFVNNDVEMISQDWDETLRTLFIDPKVGAVGVRLLYPDRTIQHAGVVLGAVGGRPVHEGRGEPYGEGGPLERWTRTREASAVTGAFLAVRADVFRLVGGFDENLPVAYNDLDFCLRVRAAGYDVLYCAEIEAIHHESKSRGLAMTNEKIAWDDGEFRAFHRRWGDAALRDPTINPHWTFSPQRSFDGIRRPTRRTVISSALEEVWPSRKTRDVEKASPYGLSD